MSMRTRIGLFTGFVAISGSALFCYQLATDKSFLLYTYERAPGLVHTLAPYLGLPIATPAKPKRGVAALTSSTVDDSTVAEWVEEPQLDFPEELKDIVGDKISVQCLLRSGKTVKVQCHPDDSASKLAELVNERLGANTTASDPIVNFDFVNTVEHQMDTSDTDDSESVKYFNVEVPEIKPNATKQELKDLELACEVLLNDLKVQEQLCVKYNQDTSQVKRSQQQVQQRIEELKKKQRGWKLW